MGEMCKMTHEVGSQNHKRTDTSVDRVRTLLGSDRKLGVKLIAEKYIWKSVRKKSLEIWSEKWILHVTMPLRMMHEHFARNPLQKNCHLPYSRCDFWLFPKLKICPDGTRIC
jgi:hypothetical protein